MKRPGPLLTLLAGLLVGVFMLSLNATTGTKNTASSSPSSSADTTNESPTATASPTPARTTPPPSPSPTTPPVRDARYAGRTDDDSSAVALTLRDGRAIAYFCDGRAKESWLRGDVNDDGTMRLTGKDGSVLSGTLQEGKRIRGTVDIDGGRYAFTAGRTKKPSGLYRATSTVRGSEVDGGWIVLPDGRQVGVLTRDGEPSRAPRLDPQTGAVTVDGQQLTARPAAP
ncbi:MULTISPECIES: hypothetical protein [unclassified Streptomyces]|uniref:hypothetical protein n=1 Tax=unclassified Streptomyces TaxID=2593676 RepID=UPI002366C906|nr:MULTISPECIES: hypothetical protein [unclassified Streptomyces]MDF3148057.1 hypothetical protein [Streptomyces sp. T21Q-yed]WDF37019.1 hypothetical protein PBV52_09610 [Streptomyces sp. T12]